METLNEILNDPHKEVSRSCQHIPTAFPTTNWAHQPECRMQSIVGRPEHMSRIQMTGTKDFYLLEWHHRLVRIDKVYRQLLPKRCSRSIAVLFDPSNRWTPSRWLHIGLLWKLEGMLLSSPPFLRVQMVMHRTPIQLLDIGICVLNPILTHRRIRSLRLYS